jgi:phosphoglycerate dehydrogenase-like enzyme
MALLTSWDMLGTMSKMKEGLWPGNNDVVDGLNGKTIGLIGYGVIAERFIRLLQTFDVQIYVYSKHCPAKRSQELGFELTSLEQVLQCDVISVHSTLTDRTYHMLDAEKLQLIPDGSILINTARGAIFDENALLDELKKNRFKAVLDVFEQEPLPEDHPFRRLPNVIATPHCAATSVYWRHKLPEIVITDMERFFTGKEPRHRITLEKYQTMTPV